METLVIARKAPIVIGRRRENNAKKIVFDISHWRELYGEGTVVLLHQRSGDSSPYPCDIEVTHGNASWIITETDTFKEGRGSVELQYRIDETVAKSEIWTTIVEGSLPDVGEAPEDPQPEWITKVLQAGEEVKNAQMHGPTIGDNGNWFVWSHEEGAYKDTGILARGETLNETDPTVPDWAKQPEKPKYTAKEVGALPEEALPEAINQALAAAKESGAFDGAPGAPGAPGKDYVLTDEDKTEIAEQAAQKVEIPSGGDIPVVDELPEATEEAPDVVYKKNDETDEEAPDGSSGNYVPAPEKAEVGQVMRVAAVDEEGKPTAWEPYSDGTVVDIANYTLEGGETTCTWDAEPNGVHYKFSRMFVYVKLATGAETTGHFYITIKTNGGGHNVCSYGIGNAIDTSTARHVLCEADISTGVALTSITEAGMDSGSLTNLKRQPSLNIMRGQTIGSLNIRTNGVPFAAGTTVAIKAVRA